MTPTNSDYVHFEDCGCEKCLPREAKMDTKDRLPVGTLWLDKKLGVVWNPRIGFGRAAILPNWIACFVIAGRHRAGESIRQLAWDYDLTRRQVSNAIAYIQKRSRDGHEG